MNHTLWLPKTKLTPPQTVERLLARPRLVSRLATALLRRRLTLLSAPAGSGKTTLALQAVQNLPSARTAWIRLNEDDNDLQAFLFALAAAWDRMLPRPVSQRIQMLAADPRSGARPILAALINDLLAAPAVPLVLVLDDYHRISNPAVHEALMYLLDHAPAHLHLLLTTRVEPPLPLARLRLQQQLSEFHLSDLKFTPDDIQTYFRQLWQLEVSPQEADLLYQRTEGWIASLHLFALALRQRFSSRQQYDFLARLVGSETLIYQLLAEEVLEHQPEPLQKFLLETAILTELTPRLCREVTRNIHAHELLEEAYRRNLFLSAVEGRASYRYHDLFREFLQRQLATKYPHRLEELHARAAQVHPDPAEKIRHYLAAQRWREAAGVLEREGLTLLSHGYIQLLQRWITALPAQQQNRPPLQYLLGTIALQVGDFSTAEHHLQQALAGFRSRKNDAAEGQVLLMLANLGSALHDPQTTISYLHQALVKPLQPHQRVQAHITSAWMHVYDENLDERCRNDILQAIQITKTSGDPRAYNILGHQLRAPLLFSQIGIEVFEEYCRDVLARFSETDSPASVGALCLLNVILLLKGQFDEARRLRRRAQQFNQQLGRLVYVSLGLDISELLDRLIANQHESFETFWNERRPFYEQTEGPRQWLVAFSTLRGLQLYLNNRIEQAEQIQQHIQRVLFAEDMPENHIAAETLSGILRMHHKQWDAAEARFQQAIDRLESSPYGLLFANPYVWLAHLYNSRGQDRRARNVMQTLFSHFRMNDFGGILLREGAVVGPLLERIDHLQEARRIRRLWSRLHSHRAVPIPESLESLTPREMEVLRLMAQGARNQEIAESLFITVRTVKAHVSRILAKIEAQSRTQAVSKARQLGIL